MEKGNQTKTLQKVCVKNGSALKLNKQDTLMVQAKFLAALSFRTQTIRSFSNPPPI